MSASLPHGSLPSAFRSARPRDGFALLITITLVAFLVLVLVSLATLTRVETQVAANSQQLDQARQNALMALNLALGQLQKTAGPDQRVTARADVIAPASLGWSTASDPVLARAADAAAIKSQWTASPRNRNWTGVWLNTKGHPAAYTPDSPADFNPAPALQAWLVSGNENSTTGDTFKPVDIVTGLSPTSTALDRIDDANGNPHRLLLKATAGVTAATDLSRAVTAPEIEIRSTATPGNGGSDTLVGHYAWWIGDEGVKARANLVDPYAATGTSEANLTRLQSAQRPAIEAMTSNGTDGLAATWPANDAKLSKVYNQSQLDYLSPAAAFPAELKTRYHDLSVTSRGVLADTKHGGLKVDLSYLFGQPDLASFQTALQAAYGTSSIAPASSSNTVFSSVATPYATLPSDASGSSQRYSDGIFNNSSTWEQLWSFANQGSTINTDDEAPPRRQTATQHGISPLIMQTKLFFSLRVDGGTVWVDAQPVVVLANPYNIKLAPADYVVRFSGTQPRLRFATSDDPTAFQPAASTMSGQVALANVFTGQTRFVLKSKGLEAGEAQIFTIDPSTPGITGDRVEIDSGSIKEVYMQNDFDPLTAITYNSGKSLPSTDSPPNTHAALLVGQSGMHTALYLDTAGPDDPSQVLQYCFNQFTTDPVNGSVLFFLVDPISSGSRVGGGLMTFYNQPPGSAATSTPQQAPFYQVNYRAIWENYSSSNSGANHPVEWARTYAKNSATAPSGSPFNPWLDAHHLRPSGSSQTTRWGIVNRGENSSQDQAAPQTLVPTSIRGTDVGYKNFLYDLPRPGQPLASIGQLEHFNTAGFITAPSYGSQGLPTYNTNIVNSWQNNYAIANSYPQPRVPRDSLFFSSSNFGFHYDGSYLWNDLLSDRFYFSTYPQTGSFDYAASADRLINARLRPFRDQATTAWDDETKFRGNGAPGNSANPRKAAENLLLTGAFNINSTSVEAWKAVLSSLKNVPVGSESTTSAPFARTLHQSDGSAAAAGGIDADGWSGFRDLSQDQIQAIAEEMVLQVLKRGPFLSLSEFVNRRLVKATDDPLELGLRGALQSAIDHVVNQKSDITAPLNVTTETTLSKNALQEKAYVMSTGLAGFPGYLLQGDVLSALGSTLSARSDTFTIRTYGDSVNPATGEINSRAWCEAIVQRTPDYVDNTPATETPAAGSAAETFGRRFQIVSFRWLAPDEI